MAKRILLAGILGGIVMFIWQGIAHMASPLGNAGIQNLPLEDVVTQQLRDEVANPGLYLFPGMPATSGMSKEQQQAAMNSTMQKYRKGPIGLLVFTPGGQEPLSPTRFLIQFLCNLLAGLLAAFLLARSGWLKSYAGRLGIVTLLGIIPTLMVNLPYWNWYGFPTSYTLAQFADQVLAFFVLGLVVAKTIKPQPAAS